MPFRSRRAAFAWRASRIGSVAALLVLGGCARHLIGPPYVMRGEAGQDAFARVDPVFQTADIPVMYVTDRAIDETTPAGPRYGYRRNRSVEFGVVTVGLSPEPTWDELVETSTGDDETLPYALRIRSVEPLGEFRDLTSRMAVRDGQLVLADGGSEALAAERERFTEVMSRWLDHTAVKDAYVFVHGFNNSFDDAVFRLAESWHYGGRQGLPIVFSWPAGRGTLTGYAYDRESGEFAVVHLKMILLALAACPGIERVHLLSHSRGTDLATSALRELHMEIRAATGRGGIALFGTPPLVTLTPEQAARAPTTAQYLKMQTLVLAAPDLDAEVFSQRFVTENMLRAANHILVYFSQEDSALALARWLFGGGRRMGDLSIEEFTPRQIETLSLLPSVEMISCKTKGYSSHSYMFMHPSAFSDLLLALREGKSAGAANGRPLDQPQPGLWEMSNDYLAPKKAKEGQRSR
jgi:esterase/lipase superfamily enzyme